MLRDIENTMRENATSCWLKRVAVVLLISACTASGVAAQTAPPTKGTLDSVLRPGMTVWITDSSGRQERATIADVSGGVITTTVAGATRRLTTRDVVRVQVRHFDSLLNGALIGAGVAVASGLALCRLTEPWENCRDDVGPMLRIGALGAGVGIGIDARIRGRRTIYEAAQRSPQLYVRTHVGRRERGLQVSFRF
jgi:hypothetical protein